jgi:hypothetical protein
MSDRTAVTSPQLYARICGVLYLYIIVAGIFAESVRSKLIVSADAAATARNIMANESLFRLAFSGELLHLACDVAVAVLLYALLRPVNRNIALLAAFMRLASDVVLAVASLSHLAALRLLENEGYLESFQPEQLQSLALLALKMHGSAYAISLVFFGFACLALGHLVFRAAYLPKALGILLGIAGACYLVDSFALFLAPALSSALFPVIFLPAFVAELGLALWLIIKGVDLTRWSATVRSRA